MIVDEAKQIDTKAAAARAVGSSSAAVKGLDEKATNPSKNTIIAGMFDIVAKANLAVEDLHRAQFGSEDVGVFHINAPGQHDAYPNGGEDYEEERRAGVMVAVNTGDGARQQAAIDALRARGAETIERAKGKWRDGDWVDFDPARPPSYIERASSENSEECLDESDQSPAGSYEQNLRRVLEVTRAYFNLLRGRRAHAQRSRIKRRDGGGHERPVHQQSA